MTTPPTAKTLPLPNTYLEGTPNCASTNASGEYSIGGLPSASDYVVEFEYDACVEVGGSFQCKQPYVRRYYDEASSYSHATKVSVTAPNTVTGIDASLIEGGKIEGVVTSAAIDKAPIAGMTVCAEGAEAEECTSTGANGQYSIEGLASGSYTVEFNGTICNEHYECTTVYRAQYYDGKATRAEADAVTLTAPATVAGIDASMFESAPKQPTVLTVPALTGGATVGATLGCSEGTWSNNPTSIVYAWLLNGAPIAGQTSSTYTIQAADEGDTLACEVTASNAAGSASASSSTVSVPKAPPSSPSKPPGIEPISHAAEAQGTAVASATATAKSGKVVIDLSCTGGGACKGTLELLAKVVKKNAKRHSKGKAVEVVIGKTSFSLAAGAKQTVEVRLTSTGRAVLAKTERHGLHVRLSGDGVKKRTLLVKPASKKVKRRH